MGTDFWIGSLLGFLAINGTLLTMFLLHGFRVIGMAIHGTTILPSLIGWGIAYLMVGLFEEFAFRRIRTAHSPPESALARGVRDVRIVRVGPSHRQSERECSGRGSCCALRTPPLPVFAADRESVVCGRLSFGLRLGASVLWSSGQWHRALSQSVQFRLSWAALAHGWGSRPRGQHPNPIALLAVALLFSRCYRENGYQTLKPGSSPGTVS